ncbi:MAG: hypothetical protein M3483_07080, partial [Gemmatimonadota bacterium]|nr:hypothetical protein [Gemmatimonadota bacterium]
HSLLNSVAIAAVHLRVRRHIPSVLVVDLGARPALGTPGLLAEMDGVRLVTVHGPAAPASGEPPSPHALPANVYDCSLSAGATGAEVEGSLREALGLATSGWRPDFVLVSMGFDVLATDPLGTLAVEVGEIHALTRALMEVAEHAGGRLVSLLEGGYDAPAAALGVVQHLRALAGVAAG